MRLRYKILISLVALISAFAIGRYMTPTKVVEKEKIVEKIVYQKDTTKKNDKVSVRLVTIKPDGTKTIETRIIDKGEIIVSENGKINVVKETDKLIENKHDDWLLSLTVKSNINNIVPTYGIQAQRRIIGPFYLGGFVYPFTTEFGVSGGISF